MSGYRDESVKYDGIVVDILSIALPAALALAADPITSLVDTAFVGHLGNFITKLLIDVTNWSCF